MHEINSIRTGANSFLKRYLVISYFFYILRVAIAICFLNKWKLEGAGTAWSKWLALARGAGLCLAIVGRKNNQPMTYLYLLPWKEIVPRGWGERRCELALQGWFTWQVCFIIFHFIGQGELWRVRERVRERKQNLEGPLGQALLPDRPPHGGSFIKALLKPMRLHA